MVIINIYNIYKLCPNEVDRYFLETSFVQIIQIIINTRFTQAFKLYGCSILSIRRQSRLYDHSSSSEYNTNSRRNAQIHREDGDITCYAL